MIFLEPLSYAASKQNPKQYADKTPPQTNSNANRSLLILFGVDGILSASTYNPQSALILWACGMFSLFPDVLQEKLEIGLESFVTMPPFKCFPKCIL